jgi:S-DNA-T family DNA segregation ATPase FtsK/SpoIIIE
MAGADSNRVVNKKNVNNKSNTNRKNTNSKSRQQEINEEELREQEMRSEVILLVVLAFSIFLIIANFGKCGLVGNAISGFLFGIIGFSEYLFPIYLFLSTAFIISNQGNKKVKKTVLYIGIVLILISMVSQMIYDTDFSSVKTLYMDGYKEHLGGGIISGGLFFIFRNTIGLAGVTLVMIIVAAIMFVLITGISIIEAVKKLVSSMYTVDDEDDEPANRREAVKEKRTTNSNRNKQKDNPQKKKETNSKVDLEKLTVLEGDSSDKPKDFFDNGEDIHEITNDGEDFFTFNNGIEKIVMHDESEKDIPVRVERPVSHKQQESNTAFNKQPEGNTVFDDEDVLAGAINGNEHPEYINDLPEDYDPYADSAFAVTDTKKTDIHKETRNVEKQIIKSGEKSYKEGARYKYPTANLLSAPPKPKNNNRDNEVRTTAIKLKNTLENFGVNVTITNYCCGPAVTRFEMQPEQGVKVSKILGLADDIKLNLAAEDIRIEAPIPGKAAIGIEVPNKENSIVPFRELVESENFKNSKSKIPFAVGKDISGQVIVTDIAKMPHVLIAGATGSGKSVCINTLIMSILYKAKPEEVKLIMVDPKMVELACYNGIPHLLIPVVTDPKKASGALNWAVEEMTRRYKLFAEYGVRNIQGYNDKVEQALASGDLDEEKLTKMPLIVVIVDELADLMMVAHGEVEDAIVRLSQLARAAGIHLVIATQRPSVDVITGLIKANVPSRIAFAVSSGVDSRTILDMNGAEKLLGKGDMLFYPTGYPKPVRVQGAFVSDEEVSAVVEYLKKQNGVGDYDNEISKSITATGAGGTGGSSGGSDKDDYFIEAGRFIIDKEKASIGMLQRAFKIGFNRAARIMDQLAAAGVVGPEEGTKARKILMSNEEFDQYIEEYL